MDGDYNQNAAADRDGSSETPKSGAPVYIPVNLQTQKHAKHAPTSSAFDTLQIDSISPFGQSPDKPKLYQTEDKGVTSTDDSDPKGFSDYVGRQEYQRTPGFSSTQRMSITGSRVDMSTLPPGASSTKAALEKLTGHSVTDDQAARAAAYLDTIAYSEGTSTSKSTRANGYDVIVGGGIMNGLDRHPGQVVQLSTSLASSAAGRYQFLSRTWSGEAAALNLQDFSPASQDAAALHLIQRAGALEDVMNGNFNGAVAKTSGIWASLPGAGYGQHENALSNLTVAYNQSLKLHSDSVSPTMVASAQTPTKSNSADLNSLRVATATVPPGSITAANPPASAKNNGLMSRITGFVNDLVG